MKLRVLFFGATAETVGERKIDIDVETKTKAAVAFEQIVAVYPNLKKHSLLFAVNQEYTDGDKIITEGDELAIFTAVSGG